MTFLPIVERELRVAARRKMTYWSRSFFALLGLLLGGWLFLAMIGRPTLEVGVVIFRVMAGMALIYCIVSSSRATADCLSSEKREGTLGLLFLTDLKGYDVIFGKLAANSLGGFYQLLAIFPVLAIPLLMGGVSKGEFWRMVLTLMNTFFLSQSVGILASALSREAKAAATTNAILMLVPTFLPFGIALVMGLLGWIGPTEGPALLPLCASPIFAFVMSFDSLYHSWGSHEWFYWVSQFEFQVLAWACLFAACRIVPHAWQDRPVRSARSEKIGWRQRWRYGNWTARTALRKRLLNVNAIFWLIMRERRKRLDVWIVLGMMASCWVGLCLLNARTGNGITWRDVSLCIASSALLSAVLKMWMTTEVGERLSAERAAGSFELLLTTPLTVRDFLRGQRLALQRMFFWPLVTGLACEMILAAGVLRFGDYHDREIVLIGLPVGLAMFLADAVAIYWVGTYAALSAKNRKQATNMTALRILTVPWVVFGGVLTCISVSDLLPMEELNWKFYLAVWFIAGLAADVGFGLAARRKLLTRFRTLAVTHHYRTPAGQAA